MDILRILEELHELAVEKPKTVMGKFTYGLNKDEVSMQIAKVRASLPNELKAAITTVRESERIVGTAREDANTTLGKAQKEAMRLVEDAKKEAERLVEQAKLQQERLVSESEILKISKAQSEEIRNSADREATQIRRGADKYAYDVLCQLEGVVGKVMTSIDRGKAEVGRSDSQAVTVPRDTREKVRV